MAALPSHDVRPRWPARLFSCPNTHFDTQTGALAPSRLLNPSLRPVVVETLSWGSLRTRRKGEERDGLALTERGVRSCLAGISAVAQRPRAAPARSPNHTGGTSGLFLGSRVCDLQAKHALHVSSGPPPLGLLAWQPVHLYAVPEQHHRRQLR